ncbi:MAG: hypothetical protein DRR16_19690 [Candidatus Parabeggiatoa sp. nov. 3]|nr:MAG: hypothetical protein DRR00_24080 [Gammaproteobacteria bacterium]RKZ61140.1 MAG: hypothetical protein DRQ99_20960 [Gammaproteobacteria bacterium]RKZ82415.1 MAG: hypothetical protein DRR16_19690 [Gammaproteobacteria bacterium]
MFSFQIYFAAGFSFKICVLLECKIYFALECKIYFACYWSACYFAFLGMRLVKMQTQVETLF